MHARRLGPYRLGRLLGGGAAGRVHAATGPGGARVAVKILHRAAFGGPGADDPALERRWLDEARIGAGIEHENVVHVLDAGVVPGRRGPVRYLVLERVEGQSLRALMVSAGRLPERLCLDVGAQVARGLHAIHARAVVHGDVKPENVLICPDGTAKLIDLGIAAVRDGALRRTTGAARAGTLLYAAPEQIRGGRPLPDGRADLYALGIVLHEMAAGRHPFAGLDAQRLARAHLATETARLDVGEPGTSPFFASLVRKLTAKAPDDRFATTADALDALERRRASRWWRRARGTAAATATSAAEAAASVRAPEPFVGRDGPLGRLHARAVAADGGRGGAVLVSGPSGVGKSRLVEALVARVRAALPETLVLRGSHPPGGDLSAVWPYAEALRTGVPRDDLRRAVRRGLGEARDLAATFLATLEGRPTPPGLPAPTTEGLESAAIRTIAALAASRLVVVVVEDVHFGPADALRALGAVAAGCADRRVLVVATTRPGAPGAPHVPANGPAEAQVEVVDLAPLGRSATRTLLAGLISNPGAAAVLAPRVWEVSRGNPFAVRAIVRDLRDRGLLLRAADGSWTTHGRDVTIGVPPQVEDVVRTRLARLAAGDRALLDAAAVSGERFDLGLLAALCGTSDESVRRRLDLVAARTGLVRPAGRTFAFEHHQVLESVLGAMSAPTRRRLHAAAADALEARLASGPPEAARETVATLAEHVLAAGRVGGRGPRVLEAVRLLFSSGRRERATSLVRRALASRRLLDAATCVDLVLEYDRRARLTPEEVRDVRILRDAARAADRACDPARRIAASLRLAHRLCYLGRYAGTFDLVRRAHVEARRLGDLMLRTHAMMRLSEAENGRRGPTRTLLCARAALAAARRSGDPSLVALAALNLNQVAMRTGDWTWRRASVDAAAAALPKAALTRQRDYLYCAIAVRLDERRWPDALALARAGIASSRRAGDPTRESHFATLTVGPLLATGRIAAARAVAVRAEAMAGRWGHQRNRSEVEDASAQVAASDGRIADALAHVARAAEACRSLGSEAEARRIEVTWAELLVTAGRVEHVGLLVAGHEPRGLLDRIQLAQARAARGAARGDGPAALAAWRAVAESCREARLEAGAAHAELEAALLDGEPGAAAAICRARDVAAEIRDVALESLALAHEVRLGGRRRGEALRRVTRLLPRLGVLTRLRVGWVLWSATGEPRHLDVAGRALRRLVAHAPFDDRERIVADVALHRAVAEAVRSRAPRRRRAPTSAAVPAPGGRGRRART